MDTAANYARSAESQADPQTASTCALLAIAAAICELRGGLGRLADAALHPRVEVRPLKQVRSRREELAKSLNSIFDEPGDVNRWSLAWIGDGPSKGHWLFSFKDDNAFELGRAFLFGLQAGGWGVASAGEAANSWVFDAWEPTCCHCGGAL